MHKFAIFDSKKQQGKTVDIFSTKKTQIDLSNQDRNVSPFRGYKQTSTNTNLPKNQDLGVSRGIFQNKKEPISNDTTPQNCRYYTAGTETEKVANYTNYAQVFQDFLSNEFKSQIGQFRNEMIQLMNESLKEFHDKAKKNQETIIAIKDSIKNHSHNIEKLDEKIEEYHSSLATISGMFQTEIEKIKSDLNGERTVTFSGSKIQEGGSNNQDERLDRVETQQQEVLISFEKLKEDLTDNVQRTLEEYTQIFEHENDERMTRISNEITKNMEQKVEKVLDHLDAKVAVLEKQIEDYNKTDDPIADKLRFELDDKINAHSQYIRQQIESLNKQIEIRSGESFVKDFTNQPELEEKINSTRQEMESLKSELAIVVEKVKLENGDINSKLRDFENKLDEQTQKMKNISHFSRSEPNPSLDASTKQMKEESEKRISIVERKFEEIRQDQRDLMSDLSIQKAQLESFKTTTAITMNDLKANQSQLEDVKLKKLELVLDQLAKNVETIKESNSLGDSTISTKFSENSLQNERPLKYEKIGINYPLTSANSYLNSENLPKDQMEPNFNFSQKNENQKYEYEDNIKKESTKIQDEKLLPSENKYHDDFSQNYLPRTTLTHAETAIGTGKAMNNKFEDYLAKNSSHQEQIWESENKDNLTLQALNVEEKPQLQSTGSPLKNNFIGDRDSGLPIDDFKDFEHIQDRRGVQDEVNQFGAKQEEFAEEENDDEVEVVYQIDENGYLMDEDGNYILDDKGEMIKLNEDQIEKLRENNLLEEENQ